MRLSKSQALQGVVFALVASAFTNIYLTQPVLPVLQQEFGISAAYASWSISAVILGITLANIPFGLLADHWPIRPILFTGGLLIALGGLLTAWVDSFTWHVMGRFLQGLFIPALTTCLVAYLARVLPAERRHVVMGSYVAATVLGGLGGRLLGGWLHPPLHWRYALVSAALLTLVAIGVAMRLLPKEPRPPAQPLHSRVGFITLLTQWPTLRLFLSGMGGFFVFSSLFNYLPFRLAAAPFFLSTNAITAIYLVYIIGIFMGPAAGQLSNRWGSGQTLMGGAVVTLLAVVLSGTPWLVGIIAAMLLLCAGFFTLHTASVGALNHRMTAGHGRANALYVLFYYLGGWMGVTLSGLAFEAWRWFGVMGLCVGMLALPFMAGWMEKRSVAQQAMHARPLP
ncbi:major facilitator superfamily MFS_1 [Magnetococcus marinus MC-1]|uniref:Major facilitator superfamily MFS_1 n=1 Tax=Magnetococcus marinus (strain ATCC BAA-1437 / JCM 17883 / MC-1) TaxID=156889 RepID=A0LAP4_MAGMM|nr:MFS transporter [Magnetococcus marinus]ABK45037.1 major facilitator superfamily MFS_1 [Magnetococcus marinus MC-1]